MTYQEAIDIWEDRRHQKPEVVNQAKKTLIRAANARIREANKRETLGQQLAYDSSLHQMHRDVTSKYYLPSGYFTARGLKAGTAEEREYIKDVVGYLKSVTTTSRGALKEWAKVKKAIVNAATKSARRSISPVVTEVDYGPLGTHNVQIDRIQDIDHITTDKDERKRLKQEVRDRNAKIRERAAEIKDEVNAMTADQIKDWYSQYRAFLERTYHGSSTAARKEFKDYDPATARPEVIANKILEMGMDLNSNWEIALTTAIQKEDVANFSDSIATRANPDPIGELLNPDSVENTNWSLQ